MSKATPDTITELHDQLSNELPTLKGEWRFSFKVFRNNIYSIPPELAQTHDTAPDSKYLYTLTTSYLQGLCITLINKQLVGVFSTVIEDEVEAKTQFSIPGDHLHNGVTSGLNDPFDAVIAQRLQSLWTQRQAIKGDGGQIYELENGNLTIYTSNVFLHGQFRGLLIHLDVEEEGDDVLARVMRKYAIPQGSVCTKVLDDSGEKWGTLALQYAETLNF